MRDGKSLVLVEEALASAAISSNTTTAGEIIDLQGYDSCTFAIHASTITDGAYAVLVEEGDDSGLSDAAAVADADLVGTEADAGFADTDDNEVHTIGYVGIKRYARVSLVSTGVTTGGTFDAVAIKGHPHLGPPVQAT